MIKLKNAQIGYQEPLLYVENESLSLGEVCLLVGNNGMGKTTLMKTILGQIPALGGEIFLQGKNIQQLDKQQIPKIVSVVFSKPQQLDNYTLTDLISLGKYIHYPYYFKLNSTDLQEVEKIINSLDLAKYKDFPLAKLSDGNLQKAFIGRAIVQNTPVIILDEPTTHLDETNKIMILQLLRDLAKKHNKLIFFSSHDWRLAKEFSDKVWWIKDKKLIAKVLKTNENPAEPKIISMEEFFGL